MSASYKKLWKILIDRDMNKDDLIRQAKITSNIVAKLGKGEDVSRESLRKICIALDCEIGDIMKLNVSAGEGEKMIIRNEKKEDYRIVDEMIKKAFWNLYVPGCTEHYFVHQVRKSRDYIPELDFVLEEDGKIIGQNVFVKSSTPQDNWRKH